MGIKVISASGGGFKGAYHLGVLEGFSDNGWVPDVYTGISIGSILSLPFCLGEVYLKSAREIFLYAGLDEIFKKSPISKSGKLTFYAYWNVLKSLFGSKIPYLGKQDVGPILKELITEEMFNKFKRESETSVYVGAVCVQDRKFYYKKLNLCKDLDEAILWINASSNAPIFTQPIRIGNRDFYDGGLISHTMTHNIIKDELKDKNISEVYQIYSRPKEYKWGKSWEKLDNIIDSLEWMSTVFSREVSLGDEEKTSQIIKDMAITKWRNFYAPDILDRYYDVNIEKREILFNSGYQDCLNLLFNK